MRSGRESAKAAKKAAKTTKKATKVDVRATDLCNAHEWDVQDLGNSGSGTRDSTSTSLSSTTTTRADCLYGLAKVTCQS